MKVTDPPLFEERTARERAIQLFANSFWLRFAEVLSQYIAMMTVWSYLITVLLLTGMKFVV